MSNGFTNEDMLKMVLERVDRIVEKQDSLLTQISSLNANGCAHRGDDLKRIQDLEGWRTKGIVGVITLSVGLLIDLVRK